jgi:hypothetical protein
MLQMQANRYEQVGSIMIDSQASINATIDGLSSELREINRLVIHWVSEFMSQILIHSSPDPRKS